MLLLANFVALFHGLIVLPAIIIGPLVLVFARRRIVWLERAFLVFGIPTALSFLFLGACFLTTWEKQLRTAAGAPSYTGGFVRHYLGQIGIDFPDIATTVTLTTLLTLGFIRVLWLWWRSRNSSSR